MALIGIGCAPVLMAALFIFARIYPPARFAMLASWTVALGTAGNVLGAAPLALAADEFGWRPVMAALGVLSVGTAAVVLALVRDPPKPAHSAVQPGNRQPGGYGELLSMRLLWALIPLTTVGYAASVCIRGLWAGPFLTDVHGAGALEIGNVTFIMALSMVAGAFVYGPLDQIFGTRKWVAACGTAVCLGCLVFLAAFPQSSVAAVTVALAILGLSGGTYGLLMAHARAFFPPHLIGRGVTLMNFFSIGGAGMMQFVTGAVVTAATVPGDPTAAYRALFWFMAGALAFGLAVYLFSRDAPPRA
jgi:MFS family permease